MVKTFKLLTINEVRKLQGWTFAGNADDFTFAGKKSIIRILSYYNCKSICNCLAIVSIFIVM